MNKITQILVSIFLMLISIGLSAQNCEEVKSIFTQIEQNPDQVPEKIRDTLIGLETVFEQGNCLQYLEVWSDHIYNQYSREMNFHAGKRVYENAYRIAKTFGGEELIARTGINCAEVYVVLDMQKKALDIYDELLKLDQIPADLKSRIYSGYGNMYYFVEREPKKALPYVDKGLQFAQQVNDSVLVKNAHEAKAVIHLMNGELLSASDEYIKAAKSTPSNLIYPQLLLFHQLTEIFLDLGDMNRAKYYALKGFDLAEQENYKKHIARTRLQLGRINARTNEESADSFFQAALEYCDLAPQASLLNINLLYHYGNHLLNNGNVKRAHALLDQMESLPSRILTLKPNYQYSLKAEIAIEEKKPEEAKKALDSLTKYTRQLNTAYERLKLAQLKRSYYEKMSNMDSAYTYAMATIEENNTLFQENQVRYVYDMESRYERGKQDQQIANLKEQQELVAQTLALKQRQNIALMIGFGLLLLVSGLIYYLYRLNSKKSRELTAQNLLIQKTLKEKDILLREIHHRVKNNLQVVSSLLSLQSRFIKDAQALSAIKEGKNRVRSMALIHQNLYQEDNLTGVEIKPYFEKLIRNLFDSYNIDPDRIQMNLYVDDLTLDVDTVIPIGLIVNELVSNSLKHAFPEHRNGTIQVKLKEVDRALILEVIDDGKGIVDLDHLQESDTFGFRMITAFKDKLNAEIQIENKEGTGVRLTIHDYEKSEESTLSKVG